MGFLDRIRAWSRPAKAKPVLEPAARDYFADPRHWTRTPESSNVHAVAMYLDLAQRRNLLGVQFFPQGAPRIRTYVFFGVPLSLWTDFLSAKSKGRFHWRRVRDQYDYTEI